MNYHVTISLLQSKEKEGYSTERDPLAPGYTPQVDASGNAPQIDDPGCAPQAGAPGYTALPGDMACDPQADAPGYDPQADVSGHASQADAPRYARSSEYTALPGGMVCDLQEGAPGNTQQDTVIVTEPGVKATQEQPVPPSNLGLSIFTGLCCCSILGKLKIGLISSN